MAIIKMWEHRGWGDSILWNDFSQGTVYGWLTPVPQVGDILYCKMESKDEQGEHKVAAFEFVIVDQQSDPRDMFFANVHVLGYVVNGEIEYFKKKSFWSKLKFW